MDRVFHNDLINVRLHPDAQDLMESIIGEATLSVENQIGVTHTCLLVLANACAYCRDRKMDKTDIIRIVNYLAEIEVDEKE